MTYEATKASLNLFAVLQNLEELVVKDSEMAELTRTWDLTLQFSVRRGPKLHIRFNKGICSVREGRHPKPEIHLFFVSPAHLNSMFEGRSQPIPIKGITRMKFLTRDFPKLTERLEYYLKPSKDLLNNPAYLDLNTRFTLNTAAYAACELAISDPIGKLAAGRIGSGNILMKVLPEGPVVSIHCKEGCFTPRKQETENPSAMLLLKDMPTANRFFAGDLDHFTAIASGDVMIKGQTPMLDSMGLILDRIPEYLDEP